MTFGSRFGLYFTCLETYCSVTSVCSAESVRPLCFWYVGIARIARIVRVARSCDGVLDCRHGFVDALIDCYVNGSMKACKTVSLRVLQRV